jgi:hypothetical protein
METTCEAVRKREWRARRRASRRQLCVCCGRLFIPARSDAAFCCAGCRQLTYRRRRVGAVDASARPTIAPWRVPEPFRPPNTQTKPEAAQRLAVRAGNGKLIDVMSLIG